MVYVVRRLDEDYLTLLRWMEVSLTPYLSASVRASVRFVSTTPRTSNRGFPRIREQRMCPILPLPSTKTRALGGKELLETRVRDNDMEGLLDLSGLGKFFGAATDNLLSDDNQDDTARKDKFLEPLE